MSQLQKGTPPSRQTYRWDLHALFALFLQCLGLIGFIGWCLEEHIPIRFSLPPIVVGILILGSLFLSQLTHARRNK